MPPETEQRVHGICVEVQGLLRKLNAFLSRGSGGDLNARLARLEHKGGDVRLIVGALWAFFGTQIAFRLRIGAFPRWRVFFVAAAGQ